MNRSLLVLTAIALPLAGCSGDDGSQNTDTQTSQSSITITGQPTTSASTTTMGTGTDGTATGTAGTESDSGVSSTGAPECMIDDDCKDGFVCLEGTCEFDPNDCGKADINVPISTPNMVLVVDKSGSMVANTWDGDNDPNTPAVTRWFSLYNVVEFIASNFNGSINLGLQLFPSLKAQTKYDGAACVVEASPEVAVAPENGAAVLAALPAENAMAQIAGGTPSRKGLEAAIAHLKSFNDGLPKFIAFITDGAANCIPDGENPLDTNILFETYDDEVKNIIAQAYADGIGVFVVGIDTKNEVSAMKADGNPDNTNTFEKLNELAVAGGYPKNDPNEQFYNAVNQIELQDALTAIAMQVLPCIITLDPIPKYPDWVEVNINGVTYDEPLADMSCSGDGWYFSKPDFSEITLCGAACSGYQMSGSINAKYLCPGSG